MEICAPSSGRPHCGLQPRAARWGLVTRQLHTVFPHYRLHSGPEYGKIVRCGVAGCGDRLSGVATLSPSSAAGAGSRAPPRVFAKLSGTPRRLLGRPSHCYQSLLGSMFTNSSEPALWILAGALSIGFSNAGQHTMQSIHSKLQLQRK